MSSRYSNSNASIQLNLFLISFDLILQDVNSKLLILQRRSPTALSRGNHQSRYFPSHLSESVGSHSGNRIHSRKFLIFFFKFQQAHIPQIEIRIQERKKWTFFFDQTYKINHLIETGFWKKPVRTISQSGGSVQKSAKTVVVAAAIVEKNQ